MTQNPFDELDETIFEDENEMTAESAWDDTQDEDE